MSEQTQKSRNIWWILGMIALVILGVVAIAGLVGALFGGGSAEAEGPEVPVPTAAPGLPSANALEATCAAALERCIPATALPRKDPMLRWLV